MAPLFGIGQKVIIKSASGQSTSPRDSTIEPYVGQIGEVTDYHWISPSAGEVFYLYTVRVEAVSKEIVLYEDEMEAF